MQNDPNPIYASASKFRILETKTLKALREKHKFQTKESGIRMARDFSTTLNLKQWMEITSNNSTSMHRN